MVPALGDGKHRDASDRRVDARRPGVGCRRRRRALAGRPDADLRRQARPSPPRTAAAARGVLEQSKNKDARCRLPRVAEPERGRVDVFLESGGFPATVADLESDEFLDLESRVLRRAEDQRGARRRCEERRARAGSTCRARSYANSIFPDTVGQAYARTRRPERGPPRLAGSDRRRTATSRASPSTSSPQRHRCVRPVGLLPAARSSPDSTATHRPSPRRPPARRPPCAPSPSATRTSCSTASRSGSSPARCTTSGCTPTSGRDRIRKARLMGLNTIETYVAVERARPDAGDVRHRRAARPRPVPRPRRTPRACTRSSDRARTSAPSGTTAGCPRGCSRTAAVGVRRSEPRYLGAVDRVPRECLRDRRAAPDRRTADR